MVSANLPPTCTVSQCHDALAGVAEQLGLTVTVHQVRSDAPHGAPPDHQITVYGADKPGIVFHVTSRLSELGVNITNMDTRLTGSPGSPVYVILLEVASGSVDLSTELDALRRDLGVDVTVQELDAEAL
jgi:glycine cleavage system transcriptional repressor